VNGKFVLPKKQFRAPSIACPRCKMTSYNVNDIREGYCGNCHDWTSKGADGQDR
jgi:ribosomal protein L37E